MLDTETYSSSFFFLTERDFSRLFGNMVRSLSMFLKRWMKLKPNTRAACKAGVLHLNVTFCLVYTKRKICRQFRHNKWIWTIAEIIFDMLYKQPFYAKNTNILLWACLFELRLRSRSPILNYTVILLLLFT